MAESHDKYIEAVGRRKRAVARVRLTPSKKGGMMVNEKPVDEFFSTHRGRKTALESLSEAAKKDSFLVTAKVYGGGISSQAEAVRHGVARALVKSDEQLRGGLKKAGLLKRDPRETERKKFGKKKARKAPQWSKR